MKHALRQAAFILLVAAIPALAAALAHPKRPSWSAETLARDEIALRTARSRDVLWIDARPRKDYAVEHVPGALLLNEDEWDALLPAVLEQWREGQAIVIYCSSRQCQSSRHVADRLRQTLPGEIYVLKGGWDAWKAARQK